LTLRIIKEIPIDLGGYTLPLPISSRVFDAVPDGKLGCKLVVNVPKDSQTHSWREFLATTGEPELQQGHWSHIRSFDRGDGVILHVLEKVAG